MDEAEAVRLGLYEPGVDDPRYLQIVDFLLERGVSIERMREVKPYGLGGVALEQAVLPPGETVDFASACERAGLAPEDAARIVRALGFPDPRSVDVRFTPADVETLAFFAMFVALVGEERAMDVVRVAGSSMARLADAVVSQLRVHVEAPLHTAGATDMDVFDTFRGLADEMLPRFEAALGTVLRRFLASWIYQDYSLDEGGTATTMELACGFADIVGFTPRSGSLSPSELSAAVAVFDATATEVVQAHGGRIVKRIGDEIMFVTSDPVAGARIALDLVVPAAAGLPPMRAGVAFGPVIARDGDYFGPVVNLAARLVAVADPGGALISEPLAERLAETPAVRAHPAAPVELKGFDEPVVPVVLSRG